mgnify:FL=1
MTAFDAAWDIVKAWGEGFRVHGFDAEAPAVTELVPIWGGTGKRNKWDDGWTKENLHPRIGGYYRNQHDMTPGRGSGTGVGGTYYHGAPWDPMWNQRNRPNLDKLLRWLEADKNQDNRMVYIPPPKNPIATTPKMRDMSMRLLRNVLTENQTGGYGALSRGQPTINGEPQPDYEWFEQASTPKGSYRSGTFNDKPALYALPQTFEDSVDLMAAPYTLHGGTYWRNVEDLVGSKDTPSLGGSTLEGNRLFDYLGQSPLVRRIMGNDYGYIDDEEYNWINDPEVLQVLNERMQNTRGLSPMNILLGDMGHDAVAPVVGADRGSNSGGREVTEGSVLLPPTTDNWWENYHPMDSGAFEMLQPHHVEGWIDEFERAKEIIENTDRGRMLAGEKWWNL